MHPAGATSTHEEAEVILTACGIAVRELRYLTSGATSQVWLVQTPRARVALRIAIPNPWESSSYESEFAIRKRLTDLGCRVARPICTNRDVDIETSVEWCLDEFIEGKPGELTVEASGDLGELLADLHSLPVEGFGLLRNRRDRLAGGWLEPRAGLSSRLERPWPFSGDPLEDHPIASKAPDLIHRLRDCEGPLLALLDGRTGTAVVHSDLHAGQLPLVEGRLAALLDFGDAVAGPPAWGIGSFAYFHGWALTAHVLDAYTQDATKRARIREEARHFAVVLALSHAARSVTRSQPARMEGALRYLRENLMA